ncbi:50S ribosomal protein L18a [Candidatus Bathyarchaeota archaeon]|nr:MAG: 50S ribosomal protein L18a [Candidatus Hecatellales archaeon]RLI34484.1 MAG: 50S ribosomal protein L18a [Candidatus Bathyarchaeota archaeon]
MSEVKTFRVSCQVKLGFRTLSFYKEVRALTVEEALEKFYSDVGSNHKLKRSQLKKIRVEEIKPEEARSPVIRMLAGVEEAK